MHWAEVIQIAFAVSGLALSKQMASARARSGRCAAVENQYFMTDRAGAELVPGLEEKLIIPSCPGRIISKNREIHQTMRSVPRSVRQESRGPIAGFYLAPVDGWRARWEVIHVTP